MNKMMDWIQDKLMPPLIKVANLRYLVAIRNGLVVTLPAIISGSVFLIVGNIPIDAWTNFLEPYQGMINAAVNASFGIISLLGVVGIGYELAKSYDLSGISGGGLALMAFIITQLTNDFELSAVGFDSTGLFTAIISAIVAVEIYHLCIVKNWVIHLPEGVPPAVGNSFVALVPAFLTLILFWIVRVPFHFNINAFIQYIFFTIIIRIEYITRNIGLYVTG